MFALLLIFLTANNDKTVEVRFTDVSPKIDGVIEDVWLQADSAYDFVQYIPYEKTEPSEKTVVYVLQDKNNLYFAFRCYAEKHKPIASFTTDEDYVVVRIDPFGSKTTGYYFTVFGSNLYYDGWIHDDGRTEDDSWEGVWYQNIKLYDDRLEAEIKIPFKSIRYKKGLDQWGIQFMRHIADNLEDDYWTEVLQQEGDLVSKWGTLTNINPQATGYYFELFPEAYVRYDRDEVEDSTEFKPSLSLNFKWDVTPQTTLNATIYPDFAQIESDPYTLNLFQYPVYLNERRPFFIEGTDIFRLSDFGPHNDFFQTLDIFYSRRVGKSMNGDAVPIIGGLKLTNKSKNWNFGMLGAYTDEYTGIIYNDTIFEPNRGFSVIRAKHKVFETSDIGMLFSGTMVDKDDYNYSFGLDGVYRKGANQLIVQGALSDKSEKRGWAMSSGYMGYMGSFRTRAAVEVVHDSFDVSDIGFVPWAGRKRFNVSCGPYKTYPTGSFRDLYFGPGITITQEPGNTNWSKLGSIEINPNFRNNWGIYAGITAGPYYEADTNYFHRSVNFNAWGPLFGNYFLFWCNYSYSYNYRRGFLAYQGANSLTFHYSVMQQMRVGLRSNLWIEWDMLNTIMAITPRLRPYIEYRFNAGMKLDIFSEFVMETPGTDFGETDLLSVRTGLLFSWNFSPKSWLYIALNDYREQDQGEIKPQYLIGAVKVKYLFYF